MWRFCGESHHYIIYHEERKQKDKDSKRKDQQIHKGLDRALTGQQCDTLASSSDLEVPALASANCTTQVKVLILSVLNFFIGKMRIMGLTDTELEEKYSTCNA